MATGTILVADDDAAIRTVVSQALGRTGYEVRVTGTAATLWRWVQAGEGDLVITDVVMPGMNGRELAERLCQRKPDLKCLFVSGYTADIIANQGVLLEGVTFLQKPYTIRELAARVREVLDST